jgi:hypothetical protein
MARREEWNFISEDFFFFFFFFFVKPKTLLSLYLSSVQSPHFIICFSLSSQFQGLFSDLYPKAASESCSGVRSLWFICRQTERAGALVSTISTARIVCIDALLIPFYGFIFYYITLCYGKAYSESGKLSEKVVGFPNQSRRRKKWK